MTNTQSHTMTRYIGVKSNMEFTVNNANTASKKQVTPVMIATQRKGESIPLGTACREVEDQPVGGYRIPKVKDRIISYSKAWVN